MNQEKPEYSGFFIFRRFSALSHDLEVTFGSFPPLGLVESTLK